MHDNACKFLVFVQNRKSLSPTLDHLSRLDYRVDRHHFKNHVGTVCRSQNNPDSYELLRGVNTSIMEQINNWFGGYRNSACYMTGPRFQLYLLLACHLNNKFCRYMAMTKMEDEHNLVEEDDDDEEDKEEE